MYGMFRGLMVILFFLVWLVLWQALAVAIIALGPLSAGMTPEQLPSLIPTGEGTPSPFVIAAGAAAVANLFLAMTAMLISEHVHSVGRFVGACFKAAIWFVVLVGGPFAAFLWLGGEMAPADKTTPLAAFVGALLGATLVTSILLSLPFLWWVSERPRHKRHHKKPRHVEPVLTDAPAAGPVTGPTIGHVTPQQAAPVPAPAPSPASNPVSAPRPVPAVSATAMPFEGEPPARAPA